MDARATLTRLRTRLSAGAQADAIPYAELASLAEPARRTRIVRLALAGLIALCTLLAFLALPTTDERRFLPGKEVGIVVLDLSTSVQPQTYDLIRQQLLNISATTRRFGVVVFSDVAYEAIPPATPARELRKFVRFFRSEIQYDDTGTPLPRSPWEQWFSAGTSISSGLLLAARLLEQGQFEEQGVVLISDLADDASDLQKLADTVALYSRRSIPLSVVALDPLPENREFFRDLLDNPGAISNVSLPTARSGRGTLAVEAGIPWAAVLFAGLVVIVLAGNLHWTEPLQVRRRRR